MNEVLEKSKNEKWLIQINTNHPDSDSYDGIVLHYSKSILVLNESENFEFNGIIFIPRKRVSGFRDSDYEICFNKIIRFNKQINKLVNIEWLQHVNSMRDVLVKIKDNNIWPVIESVYNEESSLYIGPIKEVKTDSFEIDCYDATGKWEDVYDLKFSELFKIEILDKYSKHFNAFMKENF